MIPDRHNFLIIQLTPCGRVVSFAQEKAPLSPHFVACYPDDSNNDFTGFIDMLRIGDGAIVGLRFYFFEDFEDFLIYCDDFPGVTVEDTHLDVLFTDHELTGQATPNGEQLLGGITFCISDDGKMVVSLDLTHLHPGCMVHLKEDVFNNFKSLDEP